MSKMNKKAKLRAISQLKTAPYPNQLLNVYGVPRKLIIFDINKVLLFRQAKSSQYTLRPHAREFIESMSERFTLAVWTSMTKRFAVEILADLFPKDQAPLLFQWYQNRCRSVEAENKADKPVFLKELTKVWEEHSFFNETNTILVDDSMEKCVFNPPWTCIHPHPYDPYRPPSPTAPRPSPSVRPGSRWGPVPGQVRSSLTHGGDGSTAKLEGSGSAYDPVMIDIDGDEEGTSVDAMSGAGDQPQLIEDEKISTGPGTISSEIIVNGLAIAEVGSADPVEPPPPTALIAVVSEPEPSATHASAATDEAAGEAAGTDGYIGTGVESWNSIEPVRGLPPSAPQPPRPPLPPYPHPAPPSTRPPRGQDDTLAVGGPLWAYLDRIAQYDGSIRDLYELCGPYK